jgi:hypothetical protein
LDSFAKLSPHINIVEGRIFIIFDGYTASKYTLRCPLEKTVRGFKGKDTK